MTRKTLKAVFLVLLAVFTLSSISEAAPKKTVRHRVRHSHRVTAKKPAVRKSQTKRLAPAPAATTKRIVKHKTTTKPQ